MKILRPAHNFIAEKVKNWRQIKSEALELRKFIGMTQDVVEGHYKTAFAISHAQVSDKPLNFFVINEKHKDLIKLFGSWCIINLRILKQEEPCYWKEACMSFPFNKPKNVDRYNKVTVRYSVPFLWFTIPQKRYFFGLPAFICQHENEHANGTNIYGKK